jgi:hypothetical protein
MTPMIVPSWRGEAGDGNGNRVQETIAEVTTGYLVGDQDLTGLCTGNVKNIRMHFNLKRVHLGPVCSANTNLNRRKRR